MISVDLPKDLLGKAPLDLGHSNWKVVGQERIDAFADATDDTHWSHTDPERAAAETPFGTTIAHGFLSLAMQTSMLHDVLEIRGASRWLNYGLDRLRFTNPVPAGSRVRLAVQLKEAAPQGDDGAVRLVFGMTMEVDGAERPAFVSDFIAVAIP